MAKEDRRHRNVDEEMGQSNDEDLSSRATDEPPDDSDSEEFEEIDESEDDEEDLES